MEKKTKIALETMFRNYKKNKMMFGHIPQNNGRKLEKDGKF